MKIGFIILNYKTLQKALDLAEYCATHVDSENPVLVVNNDPADVEGISEPIRIKTNLYQINTNSNLGYAKGNNIGSCFLRDELSSEVIIILNPDVEIENMKTLVFMTNKYFKHEENVCLAYNINSIVPYYHSQNIFSILFPVLCRNIIDRFYNKFININNSDYIKVGRFHGCAFAFRAKKFHEFGLLDNETFLYGEEIIAATLIKRFGYCVHLANKIKIMHEKKTAAPTLKINIHLLNSYIHILTKYFNINHNIASVLAIFICYQINISSIALNLMDRMYSFFGRDCKSQPGDN